MGSGTRVRSGLETTAAEGDQRSIWGKEKQNKITRRRVTVFRTEVGKGFVVGVERTTPVGATEEWHHIHLYSRRGVRLDLERGRWGVRLEDNRQTTLVNTMLLYPTLVVRAPRPQHIVTPYLLGGPVNSHRRSVSVCGDRRRHALRQIKNCQGPHTVGQ